MRTRFGTLLIAFFDLLAGILVLIPSILWLYSPIFPGIVGVALLVTAILAGFTLIYAGICTVFSGLWGLRHAVRSQYCATIWMGLAACAAYWDTLHARTDFNETMTGLLYYALGGLTVLTLFGALRLHVLYKQSLPEVAE